MVSSSIMDNQRTNTRADPVDTLRTHIRGVLSRSPAWSTELAAFESEAAWIIGDWATVESVGNRGPPIAQVLLAVQKRQDIEPIVKAARQDMGRAINSHSFARAYDPILQLHLLREIQMIYSADKAITSIRDPVNRNAIIEQHTRQLTFSLSDRFDTAAPAFRVREAILSMRRTAFSLATSPLLKPDIGLAWITSSKIARKAGYEQTAYSATLQAQQVDAPFTFLQHAKLSRMNGGAYKALTELENAVKPLVQRQVEMVRVNDKHVRDPDLAKVSPAIAL
jgi:serine/threonine-protein kinase ATR